MQAIVRAAFESDQVLELFKAGLTNAILAEAMAATGDPVKAELLVGQLIALGLTRHVLKLEAMALADIADVASSAGQALDTLLLQ